ncbi:tripartite tricarboxylate transporter substrate binding protein [Pigmentiphaga soli]|uniref:Tripartite tricarboxylate transporter substrate binding protein n=1 Tax=Pigmentiphaga soli TaxID=1007095 RepID=A0ABP8HQ46_9BURK
MTFSTSRRQALQAGAALLALAAAGGAQAQPAGAYPNQPVRLLVGYSPGGPTDILARQIGPALSKALGQQVVVENKPGANGNIAGLETARAQPDGYVLLMGDLTLATNPSLMKDMPFDPVKQLGPVAPVATAPLVLVVHPSIPVRNMTELLAYARSHPGQLSNGTAGNGNLTHLAGEVLKTAAKVDIRQIPYKGSGPALTDLVGGQISMVITGLSSTKGFIDNGRVRPLAITGTRRSPQLPDVPTFAEATGLPLPELNVGSWWGIFAPAGLPAPVAETLNKAIERALADPEVKARLAQMNIDPRPGPAADLGKLLASETATWKRVISQAGIVPQ